jgi:glycosyltransferase involved in cell wall biosynthesis
MNIWLINPYGPIPGEGWRDYRFVLLGRALAARGHTVTWWTANFAHHFKKYRSEGWHDQPDTANFTIRLVPTRGYSKNIGLGRVMFEWHYRQNLLKRVSSASRPDLIVGVDPPQLIGATVRAIAKKYGCPFVIDVFDLWPELFELALPRPVRIFSKLIFWPLYEMRKKSYREASAITALCNSYLQVATQESVRPNQPHGVFFNGIDVDAFRQGLASQSERIDLEKKHAKQPGTFFAVYAGSLGPNYDIPTLLEAAKLLSEKRIPVVILVAGAGPLESTIQEFVVLHRLVTLQYLGKLASVDLIKLYSICDIGICAYGEFSNVAMPDKFYDYSAAGLAIINSLRGELEHHLIDEALGLMYRPGDANSLFDALSQFARNPDFLATSRQNASRKAVEFNASVQYSDMALFVETVGDHQ